MLRKFINLLERKGIVSGKKIVGQMIWGDVGSESVTVARAILVTPLSDTNRIQSKRRHGL